MISSFNNIENILEKRIYNKINNKQISNRENSKSNNQIHTSNLISISRLAKTPDRDLRKLSSREQDLFNKNIINDAEVIRVKRNEISLNNHEKDLINNKSPKEKILENFNKFTKFRKEDYNSSEIQFINESVFKSKNISKKSISNSNIPYIEIAKEDEHSFQINNNHLLKISNNSLFEEVKNRLEIN